ncbi:hypothetical protein HN011_001543 [Eciton burchellii]|nr:hypothetical protein HN011_001543 [Eciton burchellii]
MVSFEDRYYNVNRKLLVITGLWPYQKWKFRIIQITLFLSILISFLMAQLATFITSGFHIRMVLKVLSQAFPCLVYILKYISFVINSKKVKECYERIRHEWIMLKAQNEIDILKKYANISRLFGIVITAIMLLTLCVFGLYQFLPNFLDIIVPLNKSRKHYLTFQAEYFVNQEEHFYTIVTHGLIAVYIGVFGIIATGGMLMAYIFHICAMLKIASYRFEHVSDNVPSSVEKNHTIRQRIINAINIHRRAIEFAEFLISSFAMFYFFLIGIGMSSLTFNMFQLLQLVMLMDDMNGILACALLVVSHFVYIFIGNLAGQIITDHNIDVFYTTYTTRWYTVPVSSQKLLLLVMRRNIKNYYFVVGGIFTASLEGFATLASMSISYFTVIYSTS